MRKRTPFLSELSQLILAALAVIAIIVLSIWAEMKLEEYRAGLWAKAMTEEQRKNR